MVIASHLQPQQNLGINNIVKLKEACSTKVSFS
jgi:hypothetical protein